MLSKTTKTIFSTTLNMFVALSMVLMPTVTSVAFAEEVAEVVVEAVQEAAEETEGENSEETSPTEEETTETEESDSEEETSENTEEPETSEDEEESTEEETAIEEESSEETEETSLDEESDTTEEEVSEAPRASSTSPSQARATQEVTEDEEVLEVNQGETPVCFMNEIYARVTIEESINEQNDGLNDNIYVGANGDSESDIYASGVWFPLTKDDGATFISDDSITNFFGDDEVKGIAVSRNAREITLAFRGQNSELVDTLTGTVEFFNATPENEPMGWTGGGVNFPDPSQDVSIEFAALSGDVVEFATSVTGGGDVFTIDYTEEHTGCPSRGVETMCGASYAQIEFNVLHNDDGNMFNNFFLGADDNVYASGDWFSLDTIDPDVDTFEGTSGIEVSRKDGQLHVQLHGRDNSAGAIDVAGGNVRFFNVSPTAVGSTDHDPLEDGDIRAISGKEVTFELHVSGWDDILAIDYAASPEYECITDIQERELPMCTEIGFEEEGNQLISSASTTGSYAKITFDLTQSGNPNSMNEWTYVGGDDLSDIYTVSQWFELDVADDSIDTYELAPGLIVERSYGSFKVLLRGFHDSNSQIDVVDGTIEFFNAIPTDVYEDPTDVLVFEGSGGNIAQQDSVEVNSANNTIEFHMGVNVASDAFIVEHEFENNCEIIDGGNDIPVIHLNGDAEVTITEGDSYVDPVTADDAEDGDIDFENIDIVITKVDEGVVTEITTSGRYVITYNVMDSEGASAVPVTRTVIVGEDETITENPNTGGNGGGSGGSRKRGGASSGAGQVLGASTEACAVQFTQYYTLGDKGGEIPMIQTFLNDHMNAGLTVDGSYGPATEKAVHNFQQLYFQEIIMPWVPAFGAKTTGKWMQTSTTKANQIIGCLGDPVLLEEVGVMHFLEL